MFYSTGPSSSSMMVELPSHSLKFNGSNAAMAGNNRNKWWKSWLKAKRSTAVL